jgi:AAHS family 4-hydroxybenzoate transporter-like MFS transporter
MENDNRAALVEIAELIDRRPVGRFQIRVIALCACVVFMDGFDTQAIGYVAPTLGRLWGLKPGALGPVFGAGLFGLMLGALIGGPLADRVGRKRIIVLSTLAFGICSLLTVTADSLDGLLLWRLATGLGLGGAMPNAIALTSEYSPQRSRATLVMIMFCGFSLGSALGGAFAAHLIPIFGWTAVFWLGGALPIVLGVILVVALPESMRFLALKGGEDRRIRAIFAHIAPGSGSGPETKFVAREERLPGFTVPHLFARGRALGTSLLWIMFFMNLLDLYFLANWLPTLLSNAGIAVEIAVIITTLLQIGGVAGAVSLGWLIDRHSPFLVLAAAYLVAGLLIAAIGMSGSSLALLVPAVFGAGFCIVGAQIGANALAASFYPTAIRSTGVGWALGIGRIGSIIGPVVGGIILSLRWETKSLFLIGALPAFCAAVAALVMDREPIEPSTAPGLTGHD